ncbi:MULTISPECIES: hypothetical protein [unclassified Variovorax]|uniref:hypothetical protein n=1 Tax=unclassified Variovorax TaxID=663243 RepID=UPI000F7D87D2|nr:MULTISPECIES: hypothetical protein [unclassified Variovorax]RSZ38212.1 hypothetical protein EJO70_18910 [Variovorax sp. 553]RSZ39337.1 hypothetical protein EJO71_20340 [Variovorax sp. 679]
MRFDVVEALTPWCLLEAIGVHDLHQNLFSAAQKQLEGRRVAPQARAVRVIQGAGLFLVTGNERRCFEQVDRIELEQASVMDHPCVLAAWKLAAHDAAGRADPPASGGHAD